MKNSLKIDVLRDKLSSHQLSESNFWGRKLIIISKESFISFENNFSKGIKIGEKVNYRSHHTWKHIHAIQKLNLVQIHIDYGNTYKNIFLAIPHFFIDVIPYFLRHIIIFKKPYSF